MEDKKEREMRMEYYYKKMVDSFDGEGYEFWFKLNRYDKDIEEALGSLLDEGYSSLMFKSTEENFLVQPSEESTNYYAINLAYTKEELFKCFDPEIEDSWVEFPPVSYDKEMEEYNKKREKIRKHALNVIAEYIDEGVAN